MRPRVCEHLAALGFGWKSRLGDDRVITIEASLGTASDPALARETAMEIADNGLPTSFAPDRNRIFPACTGALADRRGTGHIVVGMCGTDYFSYPDCRDDAIKVMPLALSPVSAGASPCAPR